MVDPAFALTMRKDGDRVIIERDGTGDVLKAKGRVLTLTAREAVTCGLARGIVEDAAAVGARLGMPGWQQLETWRGLRRAGTQQAPLEQAPWSFYDTVAQKAASLRTGEVQTELQKREAARQWDAWLEQNRIVGRKVQWTLSMLEASDTAAQSALGPLKSKLAEMKTLQTKATEAGRKDAAYRIQHQAALRALQTDIQTLSAEIARIEASPVWVAAASPDEPRLIVVGWFGKAYTGPLAAISPNSPLTLSGTVHFVRRYGTKDGITLITACLDQCCLPGAGPAPTVAAGKPPDPTAEQVASGKMNLVRAFRRNGFLDKAEALLKQILADYPNCSVAADAQKQLIEVQDELKQPGGKAP
jgi:hypothetical protein